MECLLCDFHLLLVAIAVALIVVANCLSGRDWYFVIPLGTIICLLAGEAGVCGVYFSECPLREFTLFLSLLLSRSQLSGISSWKSMGRLQDLWALSSTSRQEEQACVELS